MNSKLHPLRKSPTLLTYIPEPRIQHILDSNNQGFFSKQFDPRNVIELMRKGNLFNRRTAVQPELNVEDVAEQEENKREEQRIMNCNVDSAATPVEEINTRKRKHVSLGDSARGTEHRVAMSMKQHKVGCYELKLKRNKWLNTKTNYCSDDFRKLGLDLPEISHLSRTQYPQFTSLNVKPTIQPILEPLHFFRQASQTQRSPISKKKKLKLDGHSVPCFLLTNINFTNKFKLEKVKAEQAKRERQERKQQKMKKACFMSSFFTDMATTNCSLDATRIMELSKMLRPIEVEGESILLSTLQE